MLEVAKTHGEHPQNAEFALTLEQAAAKIREALKDKSYQRTPLGQDIATYLTAKRRELTERSFEQYEGTLHKLAIDHADLRLEDFEPPAGRRTVEAFLDARWSKGTPDAFNVRLSHVGGFFGFWQEEERLKGDPTRRIKRARTRDPHRTVFTDDQRHAMFANAVELRDRIAMRLLFDYALRKGALGAVQFKHFDHGRRRLTIFTKGGKIRPLPLPDPLFWLELERHVQDAQAEPTHYLMCVEKAIPRVGVKRFPDRAMTSTTLHRWWMDRLADAGLAKRGAHGTKHELNMHAARHTAGQRMLDRTGNLKAVQQLLGHQDIATTGNIYTGWDDDQLERSLMETVVEAD